MEHRGIPGRKYWQGDGITSERLCWGIILEKLTLRGCTDGGVDLKSMDTQIVDCVFEDNKRNLRLSGLSTPEHPEGIRIIGGASATAQARWERRHGSRLHYGRREGPRPGAADPSGRLHVRGGPPAAFYITKECPHGVNVTHKNCTYNGRNPVPALAG